MPIPKATRATIKIYGHRGARGLAPENTLPAYQKALEIGVDAADMDVGLTRDGVVVITHNLRLDPNITRNNKGNWITNAIPIKDLTFKQLAQYDVGRLKPDTAYADRFPDQHPADGTHIPSLKQVIDYVNEASHNTISFQIEVKTDPAFPHRTATPEEMAQAVVKVLEETKVAHRTELQAFDWRVLQAVQHLNADIATAYLTDQAITRNMHSPIPEIAGLWSAGYLLKNYDNSIPKMIVALGGKIWGPETTELSKELVQEAHEYGLKVVTWTANTPQVIKKLIDYGVDGIITDRPDIARKILTKQGPMQSL